MDEGESLAVPWTPPLAAAPLGPGGQALLAIGLLCMDSHGVGCITGGSSSPGLVGRLYECLAGESCLMVRRRADVGVSDDSLPSDDASKCADALTRRTLADGSGRGESGRPPPRGEMRETNETREVVLARAVPSLTPLCRAQPPVGESERVGLSVERDFPASVAKLVHSPEASI